MRLLRWLARLKAQIDWHAQAMAAALRRHFAVYEQARSAWTAWTWRAWIG